MFTSLRSGSELFIKYHPQFLDTIRAWFTENKQDAINIDKNVSEGAKRNQNQIRPKSALFTISQIFKLK